MRTKVRIDDSVWEVEVAGRRNHPFFDFVEVATFVLNLKVRPDISNGGNKKSELHAKSVPLFIVFILSGTASVVKFFRHAETKREERNRKQGFIHVIRTIAICYNTNVALALNRLTQVINTMR